MSYSAKDVSILIPCFGERAHQLVQNCLRAIGEAELPRQTLVIDEQFCSWAWENGELVKGFYSRALNENYDRASGDLLGIINVDTAPQPGWLTAMAREFDDPEVGAVGCMLVRPNGTLQHAGVNVIVGNGSAWAEEVRQDLPTRDVDCITGACCVVRKSVYAELGGWDPGFCLGYEDVDFFIRLRKAGYRIRYVRESRVTHVEHGLGQRRWKYTAENEARLREKWA
jgi:GT2 family glycosyltransferase